VEQLDCESTDVEAYADVVTALAAAREIRTRIRATN
jgi:hypothetical protein